MRLPAEDGGYYHWSPSGAEVLVPAPGGFTSRVAFAAAHVVADPRGDDPSAVDWRATLSYRRHLWSLGFGVAEAMDTAQRGAGVGWDIARELIMRTANAAEGPVVYGANTDQLEPGARLSLDEIISAYLEQVEYIEFQGGTAILMASRHLASVASGPDDYALVYDEVIEAASHQVMIHWLGPMFDPALTGYWGGADAEVAANTVLEIVRRHPDRVSGVKLSMLDADLEIALRRRLPERVRMFTGDDLNFVDLILGDEMGHSDALLGVFDAIAPTAAVAFQALDAGDASGFRETLSRTLPLAHHLFQAPTSAYKTGVVFLAYLNGFQDHFRMIQGAESARSLPHLARVLVLAEQAGLIPDVELAQERMSRALELGERVGTGNPTGS